MERWLRNEGGAFAHGIDALYKKRHRRPFSPPRGVVARRWLCANQEDGLSPDIESAGTFTVDFPAPRTVRNTCLLFLPSSLWWCVSILSSDKGFTRVLTYFLTPPSPHACLGNNVTVSPSVFRKQAGGILVRGVLIPVFLRRDFPGFP